MKTEPQGLESKQFFDQAVDVNPTFPIALKTELVGGDGVTEWTFRFTLQTYGLTMSYDLKIRDDEYRDETDLRPTRFQLMNKVFLEKRKDRETFCGKMSHHVMALFRLNGLGSVNKETVLEKVTYELVMTASW